MLRCDMKHDCEEPVTHIDQAGFAYCTTHGEQRRSYEPCRKLSPWEIRKLERGEALSRY